MSYVPQPYNSLLDSPVSYASQTLTEEQKQQARANIGFDEAIDSLFNPVDGGNASSTYNNTVDGGSA